MDEKKNFFKPIVESIEDVRKEGPIPFIWGGIKEGSFGYVFGPSKSGKTTFCENLAMCLVCGKGEFLGHPLLEGKHRVLIMSLEEYKRPRCERNDKQLQFLSPPIELINNLLVLEDEFPKFLTDDNEWKILSYAIAESKAGIVFIDSLTRMSSGDIERSDTGRLISTKLKKIAFDLGVTMIVIHHTPKLNGRMLSIDSLAGSHVFAQEADFLIGINKIASLNKYNGVRYLKVVACRYKREDDEKVLTFDINDYMWIEPRGQISENKLFENQDGRNDDTNINVIRTLIKKSTEIKGSSSFKSKEILEEAEKKMDKSTYHAHMGVLSATGEITKLCRGEYRFNGSSTL